MDRALAYLTSAGIDVGRVDLAPRVERAAWHDDPTAVNQPDLLGRSTPQQTGTGAPVVLVEVALGMPEVYTTATLAHELGHAALFNGLDFPDVPSFVQEGVSECLARGHLESVYPTAVTAPIVHEMTTRTDSLYGRGYRVVWPAGSRFGLAEVVHACKSGELGRVGLA